MDGVEGDMRGKWSGVLQSVGRKSRRAEQYSRGQAVRYGEDC